MLQNHLYRLGGRVVCPRKLSSGSFFSTICPEMLAGRFSIQLGISSRIRFTRLTYAGLCFGSKRLWRKQHHLEQNGYHSHEEWLQDWQDARSNEFFVLGSRDETAGCQLCVATVADDGTMTLRLRMPDCLVGQYGKYLVMQGVRFAYGHEQVLAALESNAEYAVYRREHGEKAARGTGLGQAISYRFKRDGKGWRVFVSTQVMDVPVVTDQRRGVIGVDLNADHLAVMDTDASGNYLNAWRVPLGTYGKNTNQAEALIGDAVSSVVQYAREVGKPIVIEKLDFRQKKSALEAESRRYSRMWSWRSMDSTRWGNAPSAACRRSGQQLPRLGSPLLSRPRRRCAGPSRWATSLRHRRIAPAT